MPWKYTGRIIRVGKAWVDNNGTQYPAVWNNYSADEKAAIGLTWEDEVAAHDNRFYWGRNADGSLIPRSLTDTLWVDEDGNAVNDPMTGEQAGQNTWPQVQRHSPSQDPSGWSACAL
jgi:hypothetical protein